MHDDSEKHIGTRIREFRAIRGYSLAELGRYANVSPSMLSRVENGDRYASPAIIGAVARALGVTVSVLRGQPYIHMLQQDQLDALLFPISSALDSWEIPAEDDLPPLTLDELATRVVNVGQDRAGGEFARVAEALPELITAAATVVQEHVVPGDDRERAHHLQAEVARTAAILAYRLGYLGLARLALSRMAMAAPQSGDPRQVAVERYERAQMTHAESSRPDRGIALMRRALSDLSDDGDPNTRAVRGTLMLRAAALAAAHRDSAGADDWLGEAHDLAQAEAAAAGGTLPGTRYALAFGKRNVALGRMDVAMHREDPETALRWANQVHMPENYQPTRVAGFLIRKANAQAWTAQSDLALESLQGARKVAPQLTRYHPEVHETVGTLLRARRRASDALREFAQWSGV